MAIRIIKQPITRRELAEIASEVFGDMAKAVVDTEQGIMAVGGELHADEEVLLTETAGSKREHTWGVNLYPKQSDREWIEFDSMINLKPSLGNRSRGVEDSAVREQIVAVARKATGDRSGARGVLRRRVRRKIVWEFARRPPEVLRPVCAGSEKRCLTRAKRCFWP